VQLLVGIPAPQESWKSCAKKMRLAFALQDVLFHAGGREWKGHAAAS